MPPDSLRRPGLFLIALDRVLEYLLAFGGALWRNDRGRDGGGSGRENFKTTRPGREAVAPRATFAKDATKDPLVRAMGSIETLYGTDDWGAKVLDLLTTSLTANTYSNYEGKIRLIAEFCIDEEGISPLDCTESTCVRYLAWFAERGIIVGNEAGWPELTPRGGLLQVAAGDAALRELLEQSEEVLAQTPALLDDARDEAVSPRHALRKIGVNRKLGLLTQVRRVAELDRDLSRNMEL
eukprot:jgi/Tetstr1/439086/TSEL_027576.t1